MAFLVKFKAVNSNFNICFIIKKYSKVFDTFDVNFNAKSQLGSGQCTGMGYTTHVRTDPDSAFHKIAALLIIFHMPINSSFHLRNANF
jgi:hypothetical protein